MGILTFNINAFVNSPPTAMGDNTISVNHDSTYTFTEANFTTETNPPYFDPDGDNAKSIIILTDPSTLTGALEYNSVAVTLNQIIDISGINLNLFTYISDSGTLTAYTDDFIFDIKDEGSDTFSTIQGTITMDVTEYINQPPTTGNITLSGLAYASETVITTANLTTGTTPAYSDPDADPAAYLRVNTVPDQGELRLNGITVVPGQVIDFTDITNSLFTYVADRNDTDAYTADFDFDIQDSGSGQWSS